MTGRDELTFLMPPTLSTLGMWLEQLVAESTGKGDVGILPVTGESYGFGIPRKAQAKGDLEALKRHHRRVVRIDLGENPETGLSVFGKLVDEALRK